MLRLFAKQNNPFLYSAELYSSDTLLGYLFLFFFGFLFFTVFAANQDVIMMALE